MAGASTPAIRTLAQARVAHRVHVYKHDPRTDSYGTEAVDALAAELGLAAEQIFKTLVIELTTGSLAVAVLPVPNTLSLKAAAAALGASRASMADKTRAEKTTGYVLGGISRSASASCCPPWSTRPRCPGTGCCAALGGADWRSSWGPPIWSG